MSRPHIPAPRIDLATLPPLISTGDPHSFAEFTLRERDPKILDDLIAAPHFSPDLKRNFQKLRDELLHGTIQPLREDTPDADLWRSLSKPYIGRTWFDVPWYWAETYFYRRILEIVRYFHIGAWHERDPFAPQKNAELKPDAAPLRVRNALRLTPDLPRQARDRLSPDATTASEEGGRTDSPRPLGEGLGVRADSPRPLGEGLGVRADSPRPLGEGSGVRLNFLLHTALWGNRVDLSYNVERTVGRAAHAHDERDNLLADDAPRACDYLVAHKIKHLIYVTDNAGTELALDLALIAFLLDNQLAAKITIHLKPQPFYVSDAMPQDVEHTLTAFDTANDETRELAKRLRAHLKTKKLELRVHWFYPTSLHYFEMPDDLYDLFRSADFAILKGDVNYRRLVGDAHWKPTMAFEYTTRYFPTPLLSLRTMKSDAIVGLTATQVEELERTDREWRINGKRGVAQANLNTRD